MYTIVGRRLIKSGAQKLVPYYTLLDPTTQVQALSLSTHFFHKNNVEAAAFFYLQH